MRSTQRIPIGDGDAVYIRASDDRCETHAWPTDGMAERLLAAMRTRYPEGISTCPTCIERAKEDADRQRGFA